MLSGKFSKLCFGFYGLLAEPQLVVLSVEIMLVWYAWGFDYYGHSHQVRRSLARSRTKIYKVKFLFLNLEHLVKYSGFELTTH